MAEDTDIDLNLLLALGALLEDRNLTRAGERIGMSQPRCRAALARLRRHYGDDLLEREGRGYRRTVFGEQLLPTVREALRQLDATMQRSPRSTRPTPTASSPSPPPTTRCRSSPIRCCAWSTGPRRGSGCT